MKLFSSVSLLLLLAGYAALFSAPEIWRRATAADCLKEKRREIKIMAQYGEEGDPGIPVGEGEGTLFENGSYDWWSQDPCGYVNTSDDTDFRTIYMHNDKEITRGEWEARP